MVREVYKGQQCSTSCQHRKGKQQSREPLPSYSCGLPSINPPPAPPAPQIMKRQKQHSNLSGLYTLRLNPLERTEPQTCEATSPRRPLTCSSLCSLAESAETAKTAVWLAASEYGRVALGGMDQETHSLSHTTMGVVPSN